MVYKIIYSFRFEQISFKLNWKTQTLFRNAKLSTIEIFFYPIIEYFYPIFE